MAVFPEGFVDIQGSTPQLTLTDTDPNAKSLRIDVEDPNIAQIREKAGVDNSLITLDLLNNRVGIKKNPASKELEINGAVDISSIAPTLTLTDTDPGAKSLRIDVNNNVAQIRELNGVDYSFITLRFADPTATPPKANRIGIFSDALHNNFRVHFKGTLDSTVDTANMLVAIEAEGNRPDWVETLYLDAGAIGTAVPPIRVDSMRTLECVLYTNPGTTTDVATAHMLTGLIWMGGSGTLTNAHAISISAPFGNITNSIAVRIARDTGARTKKCGFYYGSEAIGSEFGLPATTGTYAIFVNEDDCYFGGKVGIGAKNPVISGTGKLHMAADTMRLDTPRTPASASAPGNTGEICWDANFIYVCIAPNTWRRVAHTSW